MDCKNEEHKLTVLDELYNLLTISQSIIFVRVGFLFVCLLYEFFFSFFFKKRNNVLKNFFYLLFTKKKKRETADTIARLMTERNRRVINLHGGLSTEERDRVMDGFRSGSAKVLITT